MDKLYHESLALELHYQSGAEHLLRGLLKTFMLTFECTGSHPILSIILPQINFKPKYDDEHMMNDSKSYFDSLADKSNMSNQS